MADLSLIDQNSLWRKWKPVLEQRWLRERESLLWIELPVQGYVGSVVDQQFRVPHPVMSEVRRTRIEPPNWPLPSEQLTNGDFLNDEWADDPSPS